MAASSDITIPMSRNYGQPMLALRCLRLQKSALTHLPQFHLRYVVDAQKIGLLAATSNHACLSIMLGRNSLMHLCAKAWIRVNIPFNKNDASVA